MTHLLELTATEARKALDEKECSAVELTQTYLDAIEKTAPLNNYVAVTAENGSRGSQGCPESEIECRPDDAWRKPELSPSSLGPFLCGVCLQWQMNGY